MNRLVTAIVNFFQKRLWVAFVSKRFASVDKKGNSKVTGILAVLGIGFGVMTLITVMSVMNGFQMTSISPLIELDSFHVQVSGLGEEDIVDFINFIESDSRILCSSQTYQAQALITAGKNRESCALIKAVDPDILQKDPGFAKNIHMVWGDFDLSSKDSVVLGYSLAAEGLGVKNGSQVNLFALSGSKDVSLVSNDRKLNVTGVFSSGYLDIDQTFAFVGVQTARNHFAKDQNVTFSIKLIDHEDDASLIVDIQKRFPKAKAVSWRQFNRSFFNTLKIEKNILLFLVLLIFVVVGINIYNGMRRLVFERATEISTLQALGGTRMQIKSIFVFRGFLLGLKGTLIGLVLGLLLSMNIDVVFEVISKIVFYCNYYYAVVFNPSAAQYVYENPMFAVYASIPAIIFWKEVVMICAFGLLAPLIASERAGCNVLKMNIQEVLHNE